MAFGSASTESPTHGLPAAAAAAAMSLLVVVGPLARHRRADQWSRLPPVSRSVSVSPSSVPEIGRSGSSDDSGGN